MTTTEPQEVTTAVPRHPAKFSAGILFELGEMLAQYQEERGALEDEDNPGQLRVLDPFAGVGYVHQLRSVPGVETIGVELEPEWAAAHPDTIVGDSTQLESLFIDPVPVGAIVSSPCYGNRMADHHEAKDLAKCPACKGKAEADRLGCVECDGTGRLQRLSDRNTYRHALGRMPSANSGAVLNWVTNGPAYRRLHEDVMRASLRVLEPGGLILWNVSSHYATLTKGGPQVYQPVAEWHLNTWLRLNCQLLEVAPVKTPRNGNGANREVRVDRELIAVLRAPADARDRLL